MAAQSSHLFTSESVSMGHPDKVSDQVSDAVLDSLIEKDPMVRCACETLVTTGLVVVAGEITVHNQEAEKRLLNVEDTVRQTLAEIGYTDPRMKFDAESCAVLRSLHGQSEDIAMGVNREGAGDQGMMFGFACRETEHLMPMPIDLSHRLMERHAHVRRESIIKGLRPDAKSQVTIEYDGAKPVHVNTVVLSTQHTPDWNDRQGELHEAILEHVINPVMPDGLYDPKKAVINPVGKNATPKPGETVVHVNPTGNFEIGGPHGDAGLTGRKIIVDTYGGGGPHGGGAFSGKDPTKVDRSATYMARYVAKNVVAAGLAEQCEVQLAYAIGVAEPVSVHVDTFGTGKADDVKIAKAVRDLIPLTPQGIIEHLDLRRPIYRHSAYHGHFGRPEFPWEKTDMADKLAKAVG